MLYCFHGYDEKSVKIVYGLIHFRVLCDILMYCKNEDVHVNNLRVVLQTLEDCSYLLSLENVTSGCNLLLFISHFIYIQGIRVDSQKIEAVKQWPRPTSTRNIRSF